MGQLRKEAVELGADIRLPATSAKDAADAMLELSKGGLTVNQTLDAGRGVLQLSTAAQIDNAEAAKIVARSLKAFNLEGDQATKVADVLANAANASTGEITDFALGLQQSSALANAYGLTIQETTGMLARFADAGIIGSDAGTLLKRTLQTLEPTTDKQAKLFEKLGLHTINSADGTLQLSDTINLFHKRLQTLDPVERRQVINRLAGSDAARAWNILFSESADVTDRYTRTLDRNGTAQDIANAKMKGFKGALEGFKSTAETLLIEVGTKLLPLATEGMRGFTQKLSDAGPAITDFAGDAADQIRDLSDEIDQLGQVAEDVGRFAISDLGLALIGGGFAAKQTADGLMAARRAAIALRAVGFGPWGLVIGGAALAVGALTAAIIHNAIKTSEWERELDDARDAVGRLRRTLEAKQTLRLDMKEARLQLQELQLRSKELIRERDRLQRVFESPTSSRNEKTQARRQLEELKIDIQRVFIQRAKTQQEVLRIQSDINRETRQARTAIGTLRGELKDLDDEAKFRARDKQGLVRRPPADIAKAIKDYIAGAKEFSVRIEGMQRKFDGVLTPAQRRNLDILKKQNDERLTFAKGLDDLARGSHDIDVNVKLNFSVGGITSSVFPPTSRKKRGDGFASGDGILGALIDQGTAAATGPVVKEESAKILASLSASGVGAKGLQPAVLDDLARGQAMGLRLSSGLRPGAITSSGRPSLHGVGKAIDMSGPPDLMRAYALVESRMPGIRELLYTPLGGYYGAGWSPLSGKLAADHYDHVHVGVYRAGGVVTRAERARVLYSLAPFVGGGMVPGAPTPADSVPAMLSPGEFVLTGHGQQLIENHAPGLMSFVETEQMPHFREGGAVTPARRTRGGGSRGSSESSVDPRVERARGGGERKSTGYEPGGPGDGSPAPASSAARSGGAAAKDPADARQLPLEVERRGEGSPQIGERGSQLGDLRPVRARRRGIDEPPVGRVGRDDVDVPVVQDVVSKVKGDDVGVRAAKKKPAARSLGADGVVEQGDGQAHTSDDPQVPSQPVRATASRDTHARRGADRSGLGSVRAGDADVEIRGAADGRAGARVPRDVGAVAQRPTSASAREEQGAEVEADQLVPGERAAVAGESREERLRPGARQDRVVAPHALRVVRRTGRVPARVRARVRAAVARMRSGGLVQPELPQKALHGLDPEREEPVVFRTGGLVQVDEFTAEVPLDGTSIEAAPVGKVRPEPAELPVSRFKIGGEVTGKPAAARKGTAGRKAPAGKKQPRWQRKALSFMRDVWQIAQPLYGPRAKGMPAVRLVEPPDDLFAGVDPHTSDGTGRIAPPYQRELIMPRWVVQGFRHKTADADPAMALYLLLHEWAHVFQPKNVIESEWQSEGGATAFALRQAPRIAKQVGVPWEPLSLKGDPYAPFVARVRKEKGPAWVARGQFVGMNAGGMVPRDRFFRTGGLVDGDMPAMRGTRTAARFVGEGGAGTATSPGVPAWITEWNTLSDEMRAQRRQVGDHPALPDGYGWHEDHGIKVPKPAVAYERESRYETWHKENAQLMRRVWGAASEFFPGGASQPKVFGTHKGGEITVPFDAVSYVVQSAKGRTLPPDKRRVAWPLFTFNGYERNPETDLTLSRARNTLVHEWAHVFQKPALAPWEAEGGAEAFVKTYGPRIYASAELPFTWTPASPAYAKHLERVEKTKSAQWIRAGQFMGLKDGGLVPMSMGERGRDSVPAMLTPGEMVLTEQHQTILGGQQYLAGLLGFTSTSAGPGFAVGGIAAKPKPGAQPKTPKVSKPPKQTKKPPKKRPKKTVRAGSQEAIASKVEAINDFEETIRREESDYSFLVDTFGTDDSELLLTRTIIDPATGEETDEQYVDTVARDREAGQVRELIEAKKKVRQMYVELRQMYAQLVVLLKAAITRLRKEVDAQGDAAGDETKKIKGLRTDLTDAKREQAKDQRELDKLENKQKPTRADKARIKVLTAQVKTDETKVNQLETRIDRAEERRRGHYERAETLSRLRTGYIDDTDTYEASRFDAQDDVRRTNLDITKLEQDLGDVTGTAVPASAKPSAAGGSTAPTQADQAELIRELQEQIGKLNLALGIQGVQIPIIGSFAKGTLHVPETGLAMVHAGERITPAGVTHTPSPRDDSPIVVHLSFDGDAAWLRQYVDARVVSGAGRISIAQGREADRMARERRV